jgi:16S rRNA processing protein RimM
MLQIDKMDCSAIGYIQKPHGIKGEVVVVFDDGSSDAYDSLVYFFVELDGGLVPFFISDEGLRFRNNESVIVKFDFVDSQEKAKELAGCNLFVLNSDLIEPESPEIHSELIGMNVIDNKSGELGKIIRIDDFSGNVVITVAHPRAEILIPLSDDIITGIDDKKRKIFLTCPDGLIEIYLE